MSASIRVADLFCGAGGTSTGLARAAELTGRKVELLAVNHWEVAVATHAANHSWARHVNAPLDGIDPRSAIGAKKLHVLVASPECVHHSSARGGRPINDQSRASAWHVLSWAQAVEPEVILVENVPEFRTWGPIGRDGRPLKSRKGETFNAWVSAIESLGYSVAWRILNAADYGDPTTRRRLFVIARRGRRAPAWPAPSHRNPKLGADMFSGEVAPWRTAREAVIDWSLRGSSIFGRKRPLAEATLRRIAEGIRRFGGSQADQFLDFLVPFYGERKGQAPRTHSVDEPVPTIPTDPKFGLAHLIQYHGTSAPQSVDAPLPTATTRDRFGLVEPFMLSQQSGGAPRPVSAPVPTLATDGAVSLVEPRGLDVLFRMLQPHELAAAMSFPPDYKFTGTRGDVVKQIGNAVPVGVATALCRSALDSITRAAS